MLEARRSWSRCGNPGIQGDVDKAEGQQCRGDLSSIGEGERAGKVLPRNFDPCQFAMVADADMWEAERVQGIFGALDLAQVLSGDGPAVFDAR